MDEAKCIIFKCEREAAPVSCAKGCYTRGRPAEVEGWRFEVVDEGKRDRTRDESERTQKRRFEPASEPQERKLRRLA